MKDKRKRGEEERSNKVNNGGEGEGGETAKERDGGKTEEETR